MPLYLCTDEIRLTAICLLYKQALVALAIRCDLEMQITVIINNYDHDQLGFTAQDMPVLAVCYRYMS